ncbi:peptide chain release factor N(5)-glutamine methyltransferase [Algoriphagus halophytocola]|uniref:Peptide chain release factor N(5)-glutamine methyltransferase n=1 Tax=Algoriphagus halophytocola TaxID=2991499 RepID=A0ABY6MC98_9BACT|nr:MULTISPECIES: peptide chain release factor N(5)-glutamine methyltransferase [unclassified Algoriphagus]UZD21287.1 peptide chain release factor N(5)-glutamine methyltransferase [Algoriphagus sp. TR-M5]WBL42498.1 peptide chain release factor N(5)-glutamine methyltransferase [Algoriphagus sp. TR-M9]
MPFLHEIISSWSSALLIYERQEAESLIGWLFEHHVGLGRSALYQQVDENTLPTGLYQDFERLKTGEPIQYIMGKGPFYGREFKVSPATLIPRNETEELVHLIIKENIKSGLRIMDIGTGTGCIPISLALEMNSPVVFGVDVSLEALAIANQNAGALGAKVSFSKCDILSEIPAEDELDILVSNPPYIPHKEKAEMHKNVLDYEPELALFVSDEDPLVFYREIAVKGRRLLKSGGCLYFEINEKYGAEVAELMRKLGYSEVSVLKDLNGKDRIALGKTLN